MYESVSVFRTGETTPPLCYRKKNVATHSQIQLQYDAAPGAGAVLLVLLLRIFFRYV